MRDNKDILTQYLSDMVSLDKHILEAVERQAEDDRTAQFPEARQIISTIKRTMESHIDTLRGELKALGGEESGPVKEAVSAVAGIAAGLYDKVRHDPVSKMLRDDYTALSLTSIAYTMLHTTGLALQYQSVADTALRCLKDVTPLVVDISQAMPGVVVKDLADQEVLIDRAVGEEAVRKTQEAWSTDNIK
jgi:ferritin-like metal-binding protein YciE